MPTVSASHIGIDLLSLRSDLARQADTERQQASAPLAAALPSRIPPNSRDGLNKKILSLKTGYVTDNDRKSSQSGSPSHTAINMLANGSGLSTSGPSDVQVMATEAGAPSSAPALQTDVLRGDLSDCAQSALLFTSLAIPPAFLLAGIGLLADGIRRRVQTGGFAHAHCFDEPYGDDVICDHGRNATDPWYDPSDHRSRHALGEIVAGSVMAGVGGLITATYPFFFKK